MVLNDDITLLAIFTLTAQGNLQLNNNVAGLGPGDAIIHLFPAAQNATQALCAVNGSNDTLACSDSGKHRFYVCNEDTPRLRLG